MEAILREDSKWKDIATGGCISNRRQFMETQTLAAAGDSVATAYIRAKFKMQLNRLGIPFFHQCETMHKQRVKTKSKRLNIETQETSYS